VAAPAYPNLKDFGSNRFNFVREIAERVVEQNNLLIRKLESLIEEGAPFSLPLNLN
jgi:hypothetical protein